MKFERCVDNDSLWPLIDADGHHYREVVDGYISFGDVSINLLDRQCQYASRYITGAMAGYPKLGKGLRFIGLDAPGGNYHAIGIHPEDIEEFRYRFEAYGAYAGRYVFDNKGELCWLSDAAIETLYNYLDCIGAFEAAEV